MGLLDVRVLSISGLADTQLISKPDPYVVLKLISPNGQGMNYKTSVKEDQLSPVWTDAEFKFNVGDPDSAQLKFEVWNSNTFSDDLMGEYILSVNSLTRGEQVTRDVLLTRCKGNAELKVTLLAVDFGLLPTAPAAAPAAAPLQQQSVPPPSMPPQQPYPSVAPQQPYPSAPPQQPYPSAPPQQPYPVAPQQPYPSAPPAQPYPVAPVAPPPPGNPNFMPQVPQGPYTPARFPINRAPAQTPAARHIVNGALDIGQVSQLFFGDVEQTVPLPPGFPQTPCAVVTSVRGMDCHNSTDAWRPLAPLHLPTDATGILIRCRWRDQGWGNQKGQIRIVGIPAVFPQPCPHSVTEQWAAIVFSQGTLQRVRDHLENTPQDSSLVGQLARHKTSPGGEVSWSSAPKMHPVAVGAGHFVENDAGRDYGYANPVRTEIVYSVGGGGGHELHIPSLDVVVMRGAMPPPASNVAEWLEGFLRAHPGGPPAQENFPKHYL